MVSDGYIPLKTADFQKEKQCQLLCEARRVAGRGRPISGAQALEHGWREVGVSV